MGDEPVGGKELRGAGRAPAAVWRSRGASWVGRKSRAGALPPVPAALLYPPLRPDYLAFAGGGLSGADNPALGKPG